MPGTIAIGIQNFKDLIRNQYFYIDKTSFIQEWWESGDSVTLITRPRRFGKTLNMSMTEYFFSLKHADESSLFQNLDIWKNDRYRSLQGTYPVISLSFANIKETNYKDARKKICQLLAELYTDYAFLLKENVLETEEQKFFRRVSVDMDDVDAAMAIHYLSKYLCRYYGKKVIILLDEYDTPMQEAFVEGYWDELAAFTRNIFNAAFKTNPWLERGLMTGITRISKDSVFSDLNNLEVVTTTSDKYTTSFGFSEKEVFNALEEYGLAEKKSQVKQWYDGFNFGEHKDIYNPWSILNYLKTAKFQTYWSNTSSNSLVGKLLREGNRKIKEKFETLLQGECIQSAIDEQIIYNQLDGNERAVWSLLLASGYLKVVSYDDYTDEKTQPQYELALTNLEVKLMFQNMIHNWFSEAEEDYNDFIKAMLTNDLDAMNEYMNRVALTTFSYFDVGRKPSGEEPERFYHGFVLGLMVDLQGRYLIRSNQESGFGRYDVMLEPRNPDRDPAVIMEFKVRSKRKEASLEDTLQAAKKQIEERQYSVQLLERGIPQEKIYSYGFVFDGKNVLIG